MPFQHSPLAPKHAAIHEVNERMGLEVLKTQPRIDWSLQLQGSIMDCRSIAKSLVQRLWRNEEAPCIQDV